MLRYTCTCMKTITLKGMKATLYKYFDSTKLKTTNQICDAQYFLGNRKIMYSFFRVYEV